TRAGAAAGVRLATLRSKWGRRSSWARCVANPVPHRFHHMYPTRTSAAAMRTNPVMRRTLPLRLRRRRAGRAGTALPSRISGSAIPLVSQFRSGSLSTRATLWAILGRSARSVRGTPTIGAVAVRSPLVDALNPVQAEAVLHTEGPVLIVAGAGSGKTRALTHRIAYLIREHGVSPYAILAITFTNKAAREMAARVEGLLGQRIARGMWILTFHSACARILRREHDHLGLPGSFTIYDEGDTERL